MAIATCARPIDCYFSGVLTHRNPKEGEKEGGDTENLIEIPVVNRSPLDAYWGFGMVYGTANLGPCVPTYLPNQEDITGSLERWNMDREEKEGEVNSHYSERRKWRFLYFIKVTIAFYV